MEQEDWDQKRLVKISKYLAKHLRHDPEGLGLALALMLYQPTAPAVGARHDRRISFQINAA